MVKVILYLLISSVLSPSAFAQNAEEGPDFWTRFFNAFPGNMVTMIEEVSVDEVSRKTRRTMQKLKENGGQGRYERVSFSWDEIIDVVRVTSPPQNPIYGSAFGDIFGELKSHGVPVFIDAHMPWSRLGYMSFNNGFRQDAKGFFFIRPIGGNLISRHELQHIHDIVTRNTKFLSVLPKKIPDSLIRLVEKRERGEALEEKDLRLLSAVINEVIVNLLEVRASEEMLVSPFTDGGFAEIINTPTWWLEIRMYYLAICLASLENYKLLYSLYENGLSDYYSGELAIASKATSFAVIAGFLGFYSLRGFFSILKKIIKGLKQSLYGCSLAARSLLQGS